MRGRTSSALGDCVWSNNPPPRAHQSQFPDLPRPSAAQLVLNQTLSPGVTCFVPPLDFVLHGVGEGKGQEK